MANHHSSTGEPPVTTSPCPCGRPRRRALAPAVEHGDERVLVRVEGIGVLVCAAGHAEVVDETLADHLVDRLAEQVLVAEHQRLRRRDVCGHCGAVLTMPPRITETPVVDDAGPTVVTLTPVAPMVRCPDCGREQYIAAVAGLLAELTRAAVADLEKSGR